MNDALSEVTRRLLQAVVGRSGAVMSNHGAEQYRVNLTFIFLMHCVARTIPEIVEAIYCLIPSLLLLSIQLQQMGE